VQANTPPPELNLRAYEFDRRYILLGVVRNYKLNLYLGYGICDADRLTVFQMPFAVRNCQAFGGAYVRVKAGRVYCPEVGELREYHPRRTRVPPEYVGLDEDVQVIQGAQHGYAITLGHTIAVDLYNTTFVLPVVVCVRECTEIKATDLTRTSRPGDKRRPFKFVVDCADHPFLVNVWFSGNLAMFPNVIAVLGALTKGDMVVLRNVRMAEAKFPLVYPGVDMSNSLREFHVNITRDNDIQFLGDQVLEELSFERLLPEWTYNNDDDIGEGTTTTTTATPAAPSMPVPDDDYMQLSSASDD